MTTTTRPDRKETRARQDAVMDLIRPTREALGLSPEELAKLLRVEKQSVKYVWELGRSRPTGKRLSRVERWLRAAEEELRRRGTVKASLDELLPAAARRRRSVILGVPSGTPFDS